MPTPRWLETLGDQFDQLDVKCAGYIDDTHMLQLLQSLGQNCTLEDAQEMVRHFDVDGDGRIKRKDFMLRWTKNYWTREFSNSLLTLFPQGSSSPFGKEGSMGMGMGMGGGGGGGSSAHPAGPDHGGRGALTCRSDRTHSPRGGMEGAMAIEISDVQLTRRHTVYEHGAGSPPSHDATMHPRSSSQHAARAPLSAVYREGLRTSREVILRSVGGVVTFAKQLWILLQREPLKWVRSLEFKMLDIVSILILGAAFAGYSRSQIAGSMDAFVEAVNTMGILFGVLSCVWATVFLNFEIPMASREASEGVSVVGLFLSMVGFNSAVDIGVRCLAWSSMYYFVSGFTMSFGTYFAVIYGMAWSTSGIGYLCSCFAELQTSIVFSTSISFMFGAVLNGVHPPLKDLQEYSQALYWMVMPSYNRWAVEALAVAENHVMESTGITSIANNYVLENHFGYEYARYHDALIFLYASGFALRLVAFGFFYKRVMS